MTDNVDHWYRRSLGLDDGKTYKPVSFTKYIIFGSVGYVVMAVILIVTVAILSHFYSNSVKATTEAVAQLNVNQQEQAAQQVAKNVDKVQFYQNTLASGRPPPMDESQVVISWETGEMISHSVAELNHIAVVAGLNYVRPSSYPSGRVLDPARLLGDQFPLTAIIVAPVYRFLRLSVAVSGVINFLEVPRGVEITPSLAARIVKITGVHSGVDSSVSEVPLDVTPLKLTKEPIHGFSRAVPFNAAGIIELEIADNAHLDAPLAVFGDVLQIIPAEFTHAQIASFKLSVASQNFGEVATLAQSHTHTKTINEAEMFKLAA